MVHAPCSPSGTFSGGPVAFMEPNMSAPTSSTSSFNRKANSSGISSTVSLRSNSVPRRGSSSRRPPRRRRGYAITLHHLARALGAFHMGRHGHTDLPVLHDYTAMVVLADAINTFPPFQGGMEGGSASLAFRPTWRVAHLVSRWGIVSTWPGIGRLVSPTSRGHWAPPGVSRERRTCTRVRIGI